MMKILNSAVICLFPKYMFYYHNLRDSNFHLLDVGCGNHSPSKTKSFFPYVKYYGLDKEIYNNNDYDIALMTQFIKKDLERDSLADIPDGFFDVIVAAHVIEHLRNGLDVIDQLCKKLNNNGKMYIEFPSVRSTKLPSMKGVLNFYDDPTHVSLYNMRDIESILHNNNCVVKRSGVRRNIFRIILTPANVLVRLMLGYPIASAFWDILGFAEYIYAERT